MPTFTRIATSISTLLLIALIAAAHPATAQTFTVLHSFTGGADGSNPAAGLAMDAAGNLYGTASTGGNGYGTVYKLTHREVVGHSARFTSSVVGRMGRHLSPQ